MAAKKTNSKKATTRKTTKKDKAVDLPPTGPRNEDPLTGAPGSHPIETGVGAGVGGAAAGAIVGAVGGPIGAVVGATIGGAIAGALAGHGVGELIDPTTEDVWLRDYFGSRDHYKQGETHEHFRNAYRYGVTCATNYPDRRFEDVEPEMRSSWNEARGNSSQSWDQARDAARDAFDRTIRLREEKLRVNKTPDVRTGDVTVRKEVHTDHQTLTGPVEREEVVIDRRPRTGAGAGAGEVRAAEIRIPVKEDTVRVSTVAEEEVHVGKRKVHDTEEVAADVRSEELVVETEGKAKVRQRDGGHKA